MRGSNASTVCRVSRALRSVVTVHPLLGRVFVDLESLDLRWSLLRVPSNPEAPTGDVDLLVHSEDLGRLALLLSRHGFVALPGWEAPPTLLFLTYDPVSGHCLLLEVTDEVSYGPGLAMRTGIAEGLLARSRWEGGMRVPAPADAFGALLLHCLLDKSSVPERYHAALQSLAAEAGDGGAFAQLLDAQLPREWSASSMRVAAKEARWSDLATAGELLADSWRGRLPWTDRRRAIWVRGRRLLRTPGLLRRRYGVSVALLGPNGAGKSTLAEGIEQAWPLPVRRVYMGLWKSGDTPGQEIPGLAQLMRLPTAWFRYLRGTVAQLNGQLVVFDRYAHDARRPPTPPMVRLKRVYLWLLAHGVPAPDLLLLLDVPGDVSYGRKAETSLEEAELEQREFRELAAALPQVCVLDASTGIEQVRAAALQAIWDRCRRRWSHASEDAVT